MAPLSIAPFDAMHINSSPGIKVMDLYIFLHIFLCFKNIYLRHCICVRDLVFLSIRDWSNVLRVVPLFVASFLVRVGSVDALPLGSRPKVPRF